MNTAPVRGALMDLEGDCCFYCQARSRAADRLVVDHFIRWARHPDNGLNTLVLAHDRCNQNKIGRLAADAHVLRWAERLREGSKVYSGVAQGIYARLSADAQLWLARGEFARFTGTALRALTPVRNRPERLM